MVFDSLLNTRDERLIQCLLTSYATAIDMRNWARLRDCFSEDSHADYGSFGIFKGPSALVNFMKTAHADVGPTLHRLSNMEIWTQDERIQARTYVDALLTPLQEGGAIHHASGIYEDIIVRTAMGWRIAKRKYVSVTFN